LSDVPANVDLQWIGGKLVEMQRDVARLNDDDMVLTAIVNRQDGTMISLYRKCGQSGASSIA